MLGKITTGYQITIPAFFRKLSNIKVGDYIEIQADNNKLIISPVTIKNQKKALVKFNKIFSEEIMDDNFTNKSETEVMQVVNKEIKSSRNENSN